MLLIAGVACGTTYGVYHRVGSGETLPNIAKAYGVDEEALKIINGFDDSRVNPGQEVFIPGASRERYVVGSKGAPKKTDSKRKTFLSSPEPETENKEIVRIEPDAPHDSPGLSHDAKASENAKFRWPTSGVLFSKYGARNGLAHDGIDISAPEGTAIVASADGRVIYCGNGVSGYGNLIIIKHEGFYSTVYAHNKVNLVAKGDFVEAGQLIAKVGQTGRASGPHLHFEVRYNSKATDPMKVLPPYIPPARISAR